jgi:predicted transcriptional regulator
VPIHKRNRALTEAQKLEMYDLWIDGWKQTDIAAEYGVTQPAVWTVIDNIRKSIPEDDKREIRAIFMEQLRVALTTVMPRLRAGDIRAVRELTRIQERACKMYGLDAPTAAHMLLEDLDAEDRAQVTYIIEAPDNVMRALK